MSRKRALGNIGSDRPASARAEDAVPRDHQPRSAKMLDYLPAALLLVSGLAGLGYASLRPDRAAAQYLVVAPPHTSLAHTINIVRAAGGRLVMPGRFSNIVIAGSDRRDFAAALRKAGAWLAVASPTRSGCLAPSVQDQSR